ncbi:MAG: ABC transporter ATP-binding protein [Alphaproteobacteria bacterium]|nr:ABC transporter ATP-binding protein [Alphaproteobacteria bacterium]
MVQAEITARSISGTAGLAHVGISALDKDYRSPKGVVVNALRQIDLTIGRGEFVSVVGPSGCGKSTLLKCIAGIADVTGGRIDVDGKPVVEPPEGMAIVFQRDILLDWRNVIDNIMLPIEFHRLPRGPALARARDLLALIGLAGYESRQPWELSGGQRQRVAICRALIQDPALLLMDEPFGALDALTRDELNLELQRLWLQTRKTVLFITHSISEAVFLSDRVVVMAANPGRIVETIAIDLPRPRTLDARETPVFGRSTSRIRRLFEGMGFLKDSR